MLTKFILIFVSVFIGIVTLDSCQGQRDAPRYFHKTNTTIKHPTTHDVQTRTHHTATTTAAAAAKTTASHTTKAVQKKCLKKMKPNDLMNLILGLIPRIKTIEFAENENLQKLAELFEELFKH
ncbi:unnamed protein product [Schistosoma curassoni]|nr:unnamed protein product [Schistosoma curassoni]CAH8618669.1 unnamed protein product [Schistosoma curassoni]